MQMITCYFDHHDYISAVEGFARGSHLRQHIWEMMVLHHYPQMDDNFLDYCWWILYRNLWDCYFHTHFTSPHLGESAELKTEVRCGAEDFIHALAVLHRGNRYLVSTRYNGRSQKYLCYKFRGDYYPLRGGRRVNRWSQHIAKECIKKIEQQPMPENKMVEINRYNEWLDLTIYDKLPNEA